MIITVGMCYSYGDDEWTYLWAPEKVIAGETYEAVVVLDQASRTGRTVVLSASDPSIARIPQSVTILPYTNHGVFPVMPLKVGSVEIFALLDGKIVSTHMMVHPSSSQPAGLLLVLPANSTKAEDVIGYVLSVDARGRPVPVKEDTVVRLSSTPLIELEPTKTKIEAGDYQSKFHVKVRGSGKIYASAESLEVTEAHITKIQDAVTVRLAVAPNVVMENSRAFFFVWLEKDGRPYKPPHVVHAFVSSNNVKSVRLGHGTSTQYGDSILQVPLVNGVGKGYLVSQDRGSSTVTANIDGFGSARADVVVGPAIVSQSFEFVEYDENDKMRKIESRKPNTAVIWIYPSVTDSSAYGVVALYSANLTQNVSASLAQDSVEVTSARSVNWIVPVPIDGRALAVTSTSLRHPNMLVLSESNEILQSRGIGSTHAAMFEIFGAGQGNHTVFVSGPGLEQHESPLVVTAPFKEAYRIKPTLIPSVLGVEGDLLMVSVVDDSGALVSTRDAFQERLRFVVASDKGREEIAPYLNSATYSGVMGESHKVSIYADGFAPIEQTLRPPGKATAVVLDVPARIHATESFPYSVHAVDKGGSPVEKIGSASMSTSHGVSVSEGRMRADRVGVQSISVITDVGADGRGIDAFLNAFTIEIISDAGTSKLERQFRVEMVSDVNEFQTAVYSPLPYERVDERVFLITPDKPGLHSIVFVASKEGYTDSKAVFTTFAEKLVNISIKAQASDGRELNVRQQFQIGNSSRSVITPFYDEVRPELVQVSFPSDVIVGTSGYKLSRITYYNQSTSESNIRNLFLGSDVEVIADYDRMVKVVAENAQGSGFYQYGQQVVLSVPPQDKLWFLIRDVFDHWEGIEHTSEQVTFVATHDVTAKAILREDYGFLMLIASCAVSLFLYVRYIRQKGLDLGFYLRQMRFRLPKLKNRGWTS